MLASLVFAGAACDLVADDQVDAGADFEVTDAQQQATRLCLAQRGLSSADLAIPPDAVGDAVRRRAEALDCAVQHGSAEVDGDTPAERQATTDAAVALVECMRVEGWEVPDPEPAPDGGLKPPSRIDLPDDSGEQAAFREDFAVCQSTSFNPEAGS